MMQRRCSRWFSGDAVVGRVMQRLDVHSADRLKTRELAFEVYTQPLALSSVIFA